MTTRPLAALAALLSIGALASCSRSNEQPVPADNAATATPSSETSSEITPIEPTPSPAATPIAEIKPSVPAEKPVSVDEQMMDDAMATGMTAKASRGEAAANESASGDQIEKK